MPSSTCAGLILVTFVHLPAVHPRVEVSVRGEGIGEQGSSGEGHALTQQLGSMFCGGTTTVPNMESGHILPFNLVGYR